MLESLLQFFSDNLLAIYLLIFLVLLGFEVISKVPTVLHTPLMSGANAIHGVVIIGAIIAVLNTPTDRTLELTVGCVAIILGTLNVVGGFVVTDRMLEMFKKKKR
jgi:NAD(P) transhydrogenase subunit alpha